MSIIANTTPANQEQLLAAIAEHLRPLISHWSEEGQFVAVLMSYIAKLAAEGHRAWFAARPEFCTFYCQAYGENQHLAGFAQFGLISPADLMTWLLS